MSGPPFNCLFFLYMELHWKSCILTLPHPCVLSWSMMYILVKCRLNIFVVKCHLAWWKKKAHIYIRLVGMSIFMSYSLCCSPPSGPVLILNLVRSSHWSHLKPGMENSCCGILRLYPASCSSELGLCSLAAVPYSQTPLRLFGIFHIQFWSSGQFCFWDLLT